MRLASTPLTHCNQSNIPLCNTTDVIRTGKPLHIKARCLPLLGEVSAIFIAVAQREFQLAVCKKLARAPAQQSRPPMAKGAPKGTKRVLLEETPQDGAAGSVGILCSPRAFVGGEGRQPGGKSKRYLYIPVCILKAVSWHGICNRNVCSENGKGKLLSGRMSLCSISGNALATFDQMYFSWNAVKLWSSVLFKERDKRLRITAFPPHSMWHKITAH